ncbi:ATP-binding cassette domain-containing protein [Lichenicola cladoniae]|uniref:Cell division ATP-binding protein FtsE n=1 Tax=Lichenicola cladoniae TaxID=1484109 RepID=A0A6M8HUU2_9PROT|nr:ATP-binding cassette domain-containing protein [Lichenicola cladoniae]NPD66254.1 ATP-binding cassette domain-containing protein [Acetobacteraceae bacterium]QKE92108.1 ATP-binding cassette domain-containing protein [Lichenicola cladoniae]
MDEAPALIRFERVTRRFGGHPAIADISFSVGHGEIVGVIGRSGAGKSTLLRCLAGLERPDEGRIVLDGQDLAQLGEPALRARRRRIGLVFQHFNLLSSRTAAQNIALPLKIAGWTRADRARRTTELLELVGLPDRAGHYPAQLSGGQKQRVGIARALAASPALLLCDEATSALDPETTHSILALLRDINARLGLTIMLITHEMSVVRAVADRVLVLEAGRLVEDVPAARLFAHVEAGSMNEATRSLLRDQRPSLPGFLVDRLTPEPAAGSHAVLELGVGGDAAHLPMIARLATETGIEATLLEGGVTHIGQEPIGALFLAVPSDRADEAEAALRRFGADTTETSLRRLGHVVLPD